MFLPSGTVDSPQKPVSSSLHPDSTPTPPNMANSTDKPEPIRFRFAQSLEAPQFIERAAQYAKDPRKYLEEKLGRNVLEERKHLLHIPDKVDKDIYGAGEHKANFEKHIAKLFGKESGLFFITGVQAQLAALKTHCERVGRNRAAWHVTSHLETAEAGSYKHLYGLERVLLGEKDENPSLEAIEKALSLPEDQRPAVVLLEIPNRTLGSKTYTWDQLVAISAACKKARVIFHCDGARMWEIEPYYQKTAGKTFADVAGLFDSIYVSFYKGLRGAAGAMLMGEGSLIEDAKVWQKRVGGTVITLMYEIIDDERGFNENIGTFARKWKKMDDLQRGVLEATDKFRTKDGERIIGFVADPATCCQVHNVFSGYTIEELTAARDKVEETLNVRLFERLRAKESVELMTKAERERMLETNGNNVVATEDDRKHTIEWMLAEETLEVETKVFVDAFAAFAKELVTAGAAGKQ